MKIHFFLSEYFVLECKLIDMNDYINTLIKLEQKHKKENKIAKKAPSGRIVVTVKI